jgi:hypothetical protein
MEPFDKILAAYETRENENVDARLVGGARRMISRQLLQYLPYRGTLCRHARIPP